LLSLTGLVAAHVVANVVWIGSILSVAMLVASARFMADPANVGVLARRLYSRLAAPAFVVSFATGLGRFLSSSATYAHLPWMHAKLGFALLVIILHHGIGARARRLADGKTSAARGVALRGGLLFVFATCAVVLGVLKSFP
jgi:putative membrane protein